MASADPDPRAFVAGLHAVVVGFDAAGFAAADNLLHLGASVVILDEDPHARPQEAELLDVLGAEVRLGPGHTGTLPEGTDLVVLAPGRPDDDPVRGEALSRGVTVWSDAELAWRLRDDDTPWLVVASPDATPGAGEQAVVMLDAVLRAAGLSSVAVGRAGRPAVEVVMDPEPHDVLAVGLVGSQLRDVHSMSARAAAVVGTPDPPLGRAFERAQLACVYDSADPAAEALVRDAEVVEGARAIGLTLGTPSVSMLGVVEDLLADRAFVAERATSAAELATLADLDAADGSPADPATVRTALAAAALARAHGVTQVAVREGLRAARRARP